MKIPEQTRIHLLRLIDEGTSLHPSDSEALQRWLEATHEVLQFDSVQQQRFTEYCLSSSGFTSGKRLRYGVSMLKQALFKNCPESRTDFGKS